jgi:hypothetical protein
MRATYKLTWWRMNSDSATMLRQKISLGRYLEGIGDDMRTGARGLVEDFGCCEDGPPVRRVAANAISLYLRDVRTLAIYCKPILLSLPSHWHERE